MKKWTFQTCGLALVLAALPFLGACDQEQANSAPITAPVTTQNSTDPAAAPAADVATPSVAGTPVDATISGPNAPAPEAVENQLADAPGTIISTPSASANTSN